MAKENFPLNMQEELQAMGLDIKQVPPGRYIEIDLGVDRRTPEEFAEFGWFDVFTILNIRELQGLEIFAYINTPSPIGRFPIQLLRGFKTIADRFYLEHRPYPGVKLKLALGGDMQGIAFDPSDQGTSNIEGEVHVGNMPFAQLNALLAETEDIQDNTFAMKNILEEIKTNTLGIWNELVNKPVMTYYGKTVDDRPDIASVPVGAKFIIVQATPVIHQSNGTEWVVLT